MRRAQLCRIVVAGAGMSVLALLAGCGEQNRYVPPPPVKVPVARPVQQEVTRYLEATGNAAAVNSANLVARIQGYVQEIKYQDGAFVKQGTMLFVIEPEPYRLKLEQAKAAEAGAEATLVQAEAEYQRQAELASRGNASKSALDNATGSRDQARASLQQAQSSTKQAEINLGYTQVAAPFDGFVTARQISVGEFVGAGTTPTQLATIVQLDPIYVSFNVSEQDVERIRAAMARRGETAADLRGKLPVEVGLQTEDGYPHQGLLDYTAPSVNQSTGTLAVRGLFQNAHRALLPGSFLRVRVPRPEQPGSALLVPDVALGADQGGRYLLVVNGENIVEQRKVTTGPPVGELRVIESGIAADDRVVVGGLLRAVPGQKVDPQTASAAK